MAKQITAERAQEMQKILELIAQGQFSMAINDRYVVVTNPDCDPTRGDDPNIVFDLLAGEE